MGRRGATTCGAIAPPPAAGCDKVRQNITHKYNDSIARRGRATECVTLAGTAITDANLSGLTVKDANMSDVDIQDVDLTGMRINGVLVSDLFAAYAAQQS